MRAVQITRLGSSEVLGLVAPLVAWRGITGLLLPLRRICRRALVALGGRPVADGLPVLGTDPRQGWLRPLADAR